MTPLILLEQLKLFTEEKTAGIMLPVRVKPGVPAEERAAEVWKMRLPKKEDETKRIPYIVLQFVTSADSQKEGQQEDSGSFVRMIYAVYNENSSEGGLQLLHLMSTVRTALLKQRIIGNQFALDINSAPLEMLVYPDNVAPYFFGEMATAWTLPAIRREVNF